jgi:heme/copper-type cytochrome/quinol oxidase subunit 2
VVVIVFIIVVAVSIVAIAIIIVIYSCWKLTYSDNNSNKIIGPTALRRPEFYTICSYVVQKFL